MSVLHSIIAEDAALVVEKVNLSQLKGKTVLITGSSGLIGTYFLATLHNFLNSGSTQTKVIAVVHNGVPEHLEPFIAHNDIEVFAGDLTSFQFTASLPMADFIIHAAGYGQPGKFLDNQVKTLHLNTAATLNLFSKLNIDGKFLFISTSEVYSGLTQPPFKETQIGTTSPLHPRACYIEGKRAGEAIVNAYRSKGVQAKSARLSLAYGPGTRMGDARVLNNFIAKGLEGKISLLDHGLANRTYCYVTDAVEILWRVILDGQEAVYNVGGNSRITIAGLAQAVGGYLRVPIELPEIAPGALVGAPDDVYLDMSLVAKEFNKTEFVSLTEGLARTIEWQKGLKELADKIV